MNRWMNISCLMVSIISAIFAGGCAGHSAAGGGAASIIPFVKADIAMSINPAGKRDKRTATVTGEELARLLKFFPNVGRGKTSYFAGGWIEAAKIILTRDDGKTTFVLISAPFDAWSEGHGDWPLSPKFAHYLMKLLDEHAAFSTPSVESSTSRPDR